MTKDRLEATKIEVGGFATPQKTETQPVVPTTPEEEDLGTSKGAMDKISDGMQKVFELIQRFMKQIQAMGSSTLRGMAKTLGMLGFKPAAEWLNEMAGADYAELMSALKKGNLTLSPLNLEDPNAKAQTELSEGAQMLMAEQYKALAQTRGPAFTREVFYSETVTAWKKQGGNGSKTQITVEDLQAMAAASKELLPTLPGQVAQAQQIFALALENLPPTSLLSNQPTNVDVDGQVIGVRVVQDGTVMIHKGADVTRYRLVPAVERFGITDMKVGTAANLSVSRALWTPQGMLVDAVVTYQKTDGNSGILPSQTKTLQMQDMKNFLAAVATNAPLPVTVAELKFEKA
ncbi:MAG: hypothetical protein PHN33_04215 [Candidatus Peribacteraceae bacterium]|nr:hypothetical protein [Candidatus Peribacteraceae bacterium]